MAIFQKSVIEKYLRTIDSEKISQAYNKFRENYSLDKITQIKTLKEEEYQDGFLRDIFVDVFGFTLKPDTNFNLVREFKNQNDGKKADGAILKNEDAIAIIELKATNTKDLTSITNQAFNYKYNQPKCKYVITSNFQKLRFYIDNATEYEEFDIFNLTASQFKVLYLILNKESLFNDLPEKLKEDTKFHEKDISNKLYKTYSTFKYKIYNNLIKNNAQLDKLTLFKKSQKFLDRLLFIFFAEDTGLIPPNSIGQIVDEWNDLKEKDAYIPLYKRFIQFFSYLDKGKKTNNYNIPAYNGGLFASDEVLDNLIIDDEILKDDTIYLSQYDFNSEIDVNILGHIFEHSLNEIEEITEEIAREPASLSKISTRKKDGVFYTPKYITKYIVENTIGKLCAEKRKELKIDEIEFDDSFRTKNGKLSQKGKELFETLEKYQTWLKSLKIIDPACGSGAFLNQALDFLIDENKYIYDLMSELKGESPSLFNIDKSILENNLFGVDINEESVEIAKLSLWLRTAQTGRKLSDLSENIKCGNSLIDDPQIAGEKAFNWHKEFPKVFENGGFDVVIGNPPYVRQELMSKTEKEILSKNYEVGNGTADLYVYFYEKSLEILKNNGVLGFITPNKFYKTKYGKELRTFLNKFKILNLVDFFELNVFEEASTDSQILVMQKENVKSEFEYSPIKSLEDFKKLNYSSIIVEQKKLLDEIWIFNDKKENQILNKMRKNSITLKEYTKNGIEYGIKTGLNEAFIIDEEIKNQIISEDPKSSKLIKPYISGTDIKRYNLNKIKKMYFINTGYDLDISEYKGIYNWLLIFDKKLEKRQDKGLHHFNLRACKYYNKFDLPKIIYIHTAVNHAFYYDEEGYYINNSCYLISNADKFLSVFLNSKIFRFYKNLNFVSYGDASSRGRAKLDYNKMISVPIPNLSREVQEPFIAKADKMLELHKNLQEKSEKFINRIKTNLEIEKINKNLQHFYNFDFKTFIDELKKQKVKLSLSEQDEWEDYFENSKTKINKLQSEINQTDKEIDKMVYELYGLSDEEIKIVESS